MSDRKDRKVANLIFCCLMLAAFYRIGGIGVGPCQTPVIQETTPGKQAFFSLKTPFSEAETSF